MAFLLSWPALRPGAGRETGQDPGICCMTAAHGRYTERKPPLARPLLSVLGWIRWIRRRSAEVFCVLAGIPPRFGVSGALFGTRQPCPDNPF